MPNYNNSLYSNTSDSSRNGGGSWVYANGELYHYGRPGMKWYQTIFGGYDNPKSLVYDPNYGKGSKYNTSGGTQQHYNLKNLTGAKGLAKYARDTANSYRSHVGRNLQKYYVREYANRSQKRYKDFAKDDTKPTSFLDNYVKRHGKDISVAKRKAKVGDLSDTLDMFIQSAQFNVLDGVNQFLKNQDWDDEVDDFLGLILGKQSDYGKSRHSKKTSSSSNTTSIMNKPNGPTTNFEKDLKSVGATGYGNRNNNISAPATSTGKTNPALVNNPYMSPEFLAELQFNSKKNKYF